MIDCSGCEFLPEEPLPGLAPILALFDLAGMGLWTQRPEGGPLAIDRQLLARIGADTGLVRTDLDYYRMVAVYELAALQAMAEQ